MKQDYLMIGTVLKPQGIRGEAKIKSYAAEIDRFGEWDTVYLAEGEHFVPLSLRLSRVDGDFVYAYLGDCQSPNDVERLRGRELFIDRIHAAPPEEGNYIADLMGCEAVDGEGTSYGVLRDVLQYGSVDTWVFDRAGKTWMAPALLSAFPRVDLDARRILVDAQRLAEVAVFED